VTRPPGHTQLQVLGPDETGQPCPECSRPTVRRNYVYQRAGTLLFGRDEFCRACQRMAA
jgi:hypothetical protein